MKHNSDETLMVKARDENLDKIGELFERYHIKLYNFFIRQTYSESISEDLVQTVFYRIMKYRKSYKEDNKFRTWMYQIARNVLHDHRESNKIHTRSIETLYHLPESSGPGESAEKIKEKDNLLMSALSQLPDDLKEIILLNKFQGMKYNEIAEMFGTTEGAIKVKVHRAIQKLKKVYWGSIDKITA